MTSMSTGSGQAIAQSEEDLKAAKALAAVSQMAAECFDLAELVLVGQNVSKLNYSREGMSLANMVYRSKVDRLNFSFEEISDQSDLDRQFESLLLDQKLKYMAFRVQMTQYRMELSRIAKKYLQSSAIEIERLERGAKTDTTKTILLANHPDCVSTLGITAQSPEHIADMANEMANGIRAHFGLFERLIQSNADWIAGHRIYFESASSKNSTAYLREYRPTDMTPPSELKSLPGVIYSVSDVAGKQGEDAIFAMINLSVLWARKVDFKPKDDERRQVISESECKEAFEQLKRLLLTSMKLFDDLFITAWSESQIDEMFALCVDKKELPTVGKMALLRLITMQMYLIGQACTSFVPALSRFCESYSDYLDLNLRS